MTIRRNGIGSHRLLPAAVRAALAGCAILALTASALAGPAEDASDSAAAIQRLLDENRPVDGEALARDALAAATVRLDERTLEIADLNRLLGDALYAQERYAEAEPHFRVALSIREDLLEPNHPDIAVSASDLGFTLRGLGRLSEAEPLYRRALEIRRAALGPGHSDTAMSALRLARLIDARGDHTAAAAAFSEAVELGEMAYGPEHETVTRWRGELAMVLHDAGDGEAAETLYRRAISEGERAFPDDHATLANLRQSLGNLVRSTGRLAEAETLHRLAVTGREKAYGPAHPLVAGALEGLGYALEQQRRPVEALPVYERALAIREASDGASSAAVAHMLSRAGAMLMQLDRATEAEVLFRRMLAVRESLEGTQGRGVADAARWIANAARAQNLSVEAEIHMRRALEISEVVNGSDDILTGFDLLSLGMHYAGQRRDKEAEPLLRRALAIMEGSERGRDSATSARAALSLMYALRGDHAQAAELLERSLADTLETRGAESVDAADLMVTIAQTRVELDDLDEAARLLRRAEAIYAAKAPEANGRGIASGLVGDIRMKQGRPADALPIYERLLTVREERYGKDHQRLQSVLFDIGRAQLALGNHDAAIDALERSASIVERIAAIDAMAAFEARTGHIEDEAIARAATFDLLVQAHHAVSTAAPAEAALHADRAFLTAQRVIESQAANALAQMAARLASGSGELAAMVRERQDLVERWRDLDGRLAQTLSTPLDQRDARAVNALRRDLDASDARIRDLDATLSVRFPDYAQTQRPAPLDLEQTRAALADDDVLLFYADTGAPGSVAAGTFLWAIPKHGNPRWVQLERSPGELGGAVAHLRERLGVGPQTRGAAPLTKPASGDRTGEVLTAAHEIYKVVLGPVADMVEGKNLVIVPSRGLSGLPFHLLVAEPTVDSSDRYRDAAWVVRTHAVTVLPSVAALPALAAAGNTAVGDQPYLGFANPLLTGRSGQDRRAFERDGCTLHDPAIDKEPMLLASVETPDLQTLFRGAGADIDAVRRLEPLPETTDEACAIAETLGAGADAVRLGADATEAEIVRLSRSGELADARILHFATHALVAGELSGLAEPAIVLTPPDEPSALDDGLLTASEVSTLKLAADWVVLSACNTAAGDGGGEALSGLARAFFYAGARALMVSHWPVNSDAAVRLATRAIDEITTDPEIGRAEALRRSMLAEIERGGRFAEPANWAPFILVGATR